MAIRIDANELHGVLSLTPSAQNILLMGKHGIGKSEIITRFYAQRDMRVTAFLLGQMSDPGDLLGLPREDAATGRTIFMPPFWWPADDKPIVLFLDELNRARPEILQTIFDLVLNKTLAGRRLPEGSIVIAAVNEGDEYQLTDLDPALVSRFNLYEFAPTVAEWLTWADKAQLDTRVTAFIGNNQHFLDGELLSAETQQLSFGLSKTPDRRAWTRVSQFIQPHAELGDQHIKMIAGIVGVAAASAFRKSLTQDGGISAENILRNFEQHKTELAKLPTHELLALNDQILHRLANEAVVDADADRFHDNLQAYLSTVAYDFDQREVTAHFLAQLQTPQFNKADDFISQGIYLVGFLINFVEEQAA